MSVLPTPPAEASLVVDLARIVGAHGVSTSDVDRFAYGRDCWPRDLIQIRSGRIPAAPSCVVWPETPEEVAQVLLLAAQLSLPVVPFGAGSGVAGGARPSEGGITVDFKRMRAIRKLEGRNLRAEVEVGIIGERLERMLNARGYTLGHFPSSIICSTLGGWLAARSAGQTSTLYGKIEDMTLGMEVVTPGRIRQLITAPRPGRGPDYNALVIGSEGTFAAITAASLRIRPLPESRLMRGFRFPSVQAGVEAIRLMLRAGLRPAVVRLYDALDTFIGRGHGDDDDDDDAGSMDVLAQRARSVYDDLARRVPGRARAGRFGGTLARSLVKGTVRAVVGSPLLLNRAIDALPDDCLMILGFEGQPALTAVELAAATEICQQARAEDLGPGPGEHWLANRHNVSFKQSKAYASGVFTDTMEVAATWDRLMPVYRAVRRAIAREAFVMAHFSHAYPEGCSIYFTFAGAAAEPDDVRSTLERYDRLWQGALTAVNQAGGTISHHHGVGVLKADAMATEHGPGGMRMLEALKYGFDPRGIMNPGKLALRTIRPARIAAPPVGQGRALPPAIVAAVGERNLVRTGERTSIRPPDESALAAVLRIAHARGVAVASDQTGFRAAPGAAHIDLGLLEGIVRLSDQSLFVDVEAGVTIDRLEAMLGRHGLTLGCVHPRARTRTVGAGLARNFLVRRGVAHGDLRDLCFAVRGLLADGSALETRPVPRSATGPELDRALIGGFGRWGIITQATLRLAVAPEFRAEMGFKFPGVEPAVEFARAVLRRGVRPASGRVIEDGRVAFGLAARQEGLVAAQRAIVSSCAAAHGGASFDDENLSTAGRFDAVVEVAVSWTRAVAALREMSDCGEEAWLDFLSPEGVTVVARVSDRDSREAAVRAGRACGGEVVAGSRSAGPTRPATEVSQRSRPASVEFSTVEFDDSPELGPYGDVARRVTSVLDPVGVFRGR